MPIRRLRLPWNAAIHPWLCLLVLYLCECGVEADRSEQQPGGIKPPCKDSDTHCADWAKTDQCTHNPFYMLSVCPVSCKASLTCKPPATRTSKPTWRGHATAHGTRMFATMYGGATAAARAGLFRRDPSMGTFYFPGQTVRGDPWLHLSSLGTGSYLGAADSETDEAVAAALVLSVHRGWNVIDTASNYRQGRAEVAVGEALAVLREVKAISGIAGMTGREMLFISTKAGYTSAAQTQPLIQKGRIADSDVVDGMHCMHPDCLQTSLERSLRVMNLDTVDVLYLHNAAESQLVALGEAAFMARLSTAFGFLEKARQDGSIQAYGMATWDCFRKAPGSPGYLALQVVVELAEHVGGKNHGFRYVQLPINVGMPEAWKEAWQPLPAGAGDAEQQERFESLLGAAGRLGVGVFASGPLQEGKLIQKGALQDQVQQAAELHNVQDLAPKMLQLVRSTPMLLGTVVGHKSSSHVDANTAVGSVAPLAANEFHRIQAMLLALQLS